MGLFDGTPLARPVLCDRCGQYVRSCNCPRLGEGQDPQASAAELAPAKQRLRIRLEKRKRGKLVTVVDGFRGSPSQLRRVLRELKNGCGAGGTLADTQLELQGDHCQRARQLLEAQGFRVAG